MENVAQKRPKPRGHLSDGALAPGVASRANGQYRSDHLDDGNPTADVPVLLVKGLDDSVGAVALRFRCEVENEQPTQEPAQSRNEQNPDALRPFGNAIGRHGAGLALVRQGHAAHPLHSQAGGEVQRITENESGQSRDDANQKAVPEKARDVREEDSGAPVPAEKSLSDAVGACVPMVVVLPVRRSPPRASLPSPEGTCFTHSAATRDPHSLRPPLSAGLPHCLDASAFSHGPKPLIPSAASASRTPSLWARPRRGGRCGSPGAAPCPRRRRSGSACACPRESPGRA